MMKRYLLLLLLVFLASCKSKAVLAEAGAAKKLTAAKIIEGHNANKANFTTLYIKSDAHYEDSKQSQSVTAEIRIKKDEMILVSIRFLGITMAKALITPQGVQYYEKINQNYFEGNYTALSKWLGTDLDFQKVQNLLIGHALDDLSKGAYTATIEDQLYKLSGADGGTQKEFVFEAAKFFLKGVRVSQPAQNRDLQVFYPGYTAYDQMALPASINIEATNKGAKTKIDVDYKSISFNEELSFPYSVPEGYEQIFIN